MWGCSTISNSPIVCLLEKAVYSVIRVPGVDKSLKTNFEGISPQTRNHKQRSLLCRNNLEIAADRELRRRTIWPSKTDL